jgi:hypothetical protein
MVPPPPNQAPRAGGGGYRGGAGTFAPPVGQHARVVDRRDAGMIERGQHARLAAQALVETAAGRRRVRHLERHFSPERLVARDVDGAHAATPDHAQHGVTAAIVARRHFGPHRCFAQVIDDAIR